MNVLRCQGVRIEDAMPLLKKQIVSYHSFLKQTKAYMLRVREDGSGRKRYQFIVDIHKNGRQIYKSKTFDSKREGLSWEKKLRYEVETGVITKDTLKKHKVSDAIKKYIEMILVKYPKNAHNVRQHLQWWQNQIGTILLSEVTAALCVECRDKLLTEVGPKGKVRKSGTALRYIASMSAVFQACVQEWMWLSQNPIRLIKKPPPGRRKMRAFSTEEIKIIQKFCRESNSLFMLPIFIIALHTGMRRGEILSLRVEHVDFHQREIHLPTSKNGEPRNVAMTHEVYKTLWDLIAGKKASIGGLIFPSPADPTKPIDIKSTWERILAKAGVVDANFHTIRHTTCSFLASLGIDRTLIARIVGHKDSRTTDIYIDLIKPHHHEAMRQLEASFSAGTDA